MSEQGVERRWLLFRRGDQSYAIEAVSVRCVLPSPRVSPFASERPALRGLIAHLGKLHALVEPSERPDSCADASCAVAVITRAEDGDLAFTADVVAGFASDVGEATLLDPRAAERRVREGLRTATRPR